MADLGQRRVVSWTRLEAVQPNWFTGEFGAMVGEVKTHPDFVAAMKRRGITDLTFTSEQRKNRVGYPTSYQLMPGMNAMTLLTADDYACRRAAFLDHHLWVTPYRYEERHAAGDYPTLSTAGQGLPAHSVG